MRSRLPQCLPLRLPARDALVPRLLVLNVAHEPVEFRQDEYERDGLVLKEPEEVFFGGLDRAVVGEGYAVPLFPPPPKVSISLA